MILFGPNNFVSHFSVNNRLRPTADIIAVCTYRLVMISIERSETAQKGTLEIQDKFSPRQSAV